MAIIAICVALLLVVEVKSVRHHHVFDKCWSQSECDGSFCSTAGHCHPCKWCKDCIDGIDRTCGACGETTDGHDCNGCANWCLTDGADWSQKCTLDQCAGCEICKTPCTFDVETCNKKCRDSCTEIRIPWDGTSVNPETACNNCPSPAQLEANFCPLAEGEYECHPGAPDYKEVEKVRFYVSEAYEPYRMKISKFPQCCGWTDRFSFYAYEKEGVPSTTLFYVSEAHSPERFKISTDPPCCGWTDVYKFYAYTKREQTWHTSAVRFYVSEALGPDRFKISKDPQCCEWTDKFEFWAFEDEAAHEDEAVHEDEEGLYEDEAVHDGYYEDYEDEEELECEYFADFSQNNLGLVAYSVKGVVIDEGIIFRWYNHIYHKLVLTDTEGNYVKRGYVRSSETSTNWMTPSSWTVYDYYTLSNFKSECKTTEELALASENQKLKTANKALRQALKQMQHE